MHSILRYALHCIALRLVSSLLADQTHATPCLLELDLSLKFLSLSPRFDFQNTKMQDPKVLADILTTLQRLESRFGDQTDRLATIELSVRSGATSPTPPSVYRPSTALNRYSVEEMAADHQASVARLRNRFDFIDDENQDKMYARVVDDAGDWQSVSVYSSRPHSQVFLDGFPLPLPPPVPPKDERRALHVNTALNNNENTTNSLPNADLTFLVPPRFELLPTPPPTNSTSTSTTTQLSTNPFPFPPSTPPTTTSITTSHFHIRRPTRMYTDQNNTPERAGQAAWKNWRYWIRHGPGYRLDAAKAAFRDSRVNYAKASMVEKGLRMRRGAGRAVKGCLRVVPNFFAWAGRKMVREQVKRLDLSV